jgi:Flp pilus assembly protein TadG
MANHLDSNFGGTMLNSIRRTLNKLKGETSGNATLIVALGMPVLIGGSGLAVDTAQWYMWKRELQNAADQAALAGAWAKSSATSASTYSARAAQEFNSNVDKTAAIVTTPAVSVVSHGTGTNNAVLVTASASKTLPFSNIVTGNTTTVNVSAKAAFTSGATYTTCLLAIHPTAAQAFKFGGSVSGSSNCGAGSLSTDPAAAMKEVGNTSVPLGSLVSAGGIDDGFENNLGSTGSIHENETGLGDPYGSLATPPMNTSTNQTYTCPTGTSGTSAYTTADVTVRTERSYAYYTKSGNTYTPAPTYSGTYKREYTDGAPGVTTQDVTVTSTTPTTVGPNTSDYVKWGSGSTVIYEKETTTVYTTYSDIQPHEGSGGVAGGPATPQPGIYTSISIDCDTNFAPGIYFTGSIDFGQNHTITGAGVLFVITSSSGNITINSNSDMDISGITAAKLIADYNYSPADAAKMAGMVFWDKESSQSFNMNGNADVKIDGVFYMPNRETTFNGTAAANVASGKCMMVVSSMMTINGNFNVTNFCTPSGVSAMNIGGGTASVKLVS